MRDRQDIDPSGLRVERTTSYAHKTSYRRRAIPCATEQQSNKSAELTGVPTDWDLGNMPAPIKRGLAQSTLGAFDIAIARDRLGQELARRLPGGVVSVWERDTFARPTEQRILTGATTQSPGRSVSTHQYQWGAPEEIASIATLGSDAKLRARSSFEYDPRGHLVRQLRATPCAPENGVANGETLVRQTDSVGNLYRSADLGDREYGKGGVIRRAGGTLYETDADGFLVKKTLADGAVWHYAWDAHGQLTEVTRPDKKKVAYSYDAFGRRVSKTFDGATTAFIWDGDDLVHERVQGQDGAFLPLTTRVFEPGSFTPLAKIEGRKRYGIVGDHLGAPTMLATEAGELAWQAQLDIYGVPREDLSGIKAEHKTDNPWRYPGQYEDKETGLYYNRFRYYDPELGRYISEDPIGLEGGLPQYGYVHDPLGWVDPWGLSGGCGVGDAGKAIGFAPGEGASAFAADRLQHASRHLTGAGLLPNWSKSTGQKFSEAGSQILENPRATFDHVLKGGQAVKGFLGEIDGQNVAVLVYKSGANAGKVATSVVPSAQQLANWGF